ncbi:MAG: hypothetical protein JWR65_2450, partial [Massilia sp.]|nr:hypothetical protein [Massilia sp.]
MRLPNHFISTTRNHMTKTLIIAEKPS